MRREIAAIALGLLAAGCASERVILLPSPDGHASRLAVQHGSTQSELTVPYQAVEVSGGSGRLTSVTEADVQRTFGDTLAALPQAPKSYVLYFETDSIEAISPDSKVLLDDALRDVGTRVAPEVTIIGHTDRLGDQAYNDQLSRSRANTIAQQFRARLRALKLDDAHVDAAGRGEREPLVPTADEVSEARNRRVEIEVR